MEKICRFCLKVSIKNMCSLQECDIHYNIQKFLTIKIPTEDSFPSNLCKECFKKISQIIKFCITLQDNEDKLQYYSRSGILQDYYSRITNNKQINDEQKELKIETNYVKVEQKELKVEMQYVKDERKELKIETHYLQVEDNIKLDFEDYDHLEEELSDDINETNCSSGDEITLPSIKQEQEINSDAPLKKITKFRPIKSLIPKRKKNKKEPENIEYVKPFTCLTCLIECNSQAELTKHYYAKHYRKLTGDKNYTEHKSEDKTTYSCNSCEKTCNSKKNIVKHIMSHTDDSNERPLICKLCARTYRRVPDIVRHARAHNGLKLQCPYNCGFSTAYQGSMEEHKKRHLDEYKYTCGTCGKGFNTKTWYEQHQNLHTGHKPFVCNICGIAFPLSRYLQTHKSTRHPQSSSLKRYQCVHCDEKCDCAKSLALHLQKHGIKKDTDSLCDFCGKIVPSISQLQYHHRMHLGVKPYSCTICKKKFAKKYNLRLHMSIHTGGQSHVCVHCGKIYSQRSTLLKHIKCYHGGDTSAHRRGHTGITKTET